MSSGERWPLADLVTTAVSPQLSIPSYLLRSLYDLAIICSGDSYIFYTNLCNKLEHSLAIEPAGDKEAEQQQASLNPDGERSGEPTRTRTPNDFLEDRPLTTTGLPESATSLSSHLHSTIWRRSEEQRDTTSAIRTCRLLLEAPRARPRQMTRRHSMPSASRRARLRICWTPGRILSSRIYQPLEDFSLSSRS